MHKLIVCRHCDHIIKLPELKCGQKAFCGYCQAPVFEPKETSVQGAFAFALAALILLISALTYEFISFTMGGITHSVSLMSALPTLAQHNGALLAIILMTFVVFFPAIILLTVLAMYSPIWLYVPLKVARRLTKLLSHAEPWNMSEIFLIAILVSLIKLITLADIQFGPSFWAYAGFVACFIQMLNLIQLDSLWERITPYESPIFVDLSKRASDQGLVSCPTCGQVSSKHRCPRCETALFSRKPDSVNKVTAWLVTSIVLFFPANLLPIMNTQQLQDVIPSTIVTGVLQLWNAGSYPIAIIIFIASVLIPVLKLVAIGVLLYQVKQLSHDNSRHYTKIYRYIELIGKWSMIDVFVVIFLVSLVQLGVFMSVTADIGTLFFALMVFAQIMAVHYFDPRLIWDNPKERHG
ncbi:Paraquat-inducible protein A [Pseudoalteromonas luteoviolacea B = ATCC 29581]|nr:Paraquat-inducible protein A [Pseudoalteromonas luteoviolacea B = ATCC 29581]